MASILSMLLPHKQFVKLQSKKVIRVEVNALEVIQNLIETGGYLEDFDYDNDGYITENDYHYLYDIFYLNWDSFLSNPDNAKYVNTDKSEPNILLLVHLKKLYAAHAFETNLNITGNGNMVIDKMDITVCKRWLLFGKTLNPYQSSYATWKAKQSLLTSNGGNEIG